MAAKSASIAINIIGNAKGFVKELDSANNSFKKFYNQFSLADGAANKFKIAQTSAFDYVKKNAFTFAAAAGAAIGAFGVQSVKAFQDLTLTVSKFSDATGMSLDAASRFIEVAGDIGIESETLEKSLGFMNKTLGNNADLFKQLGIEIEYTSGGAKDMSGTFLNVIDRIKGIKDPAEKAAVASQLLGRGWQQMAELIETGSGSLSKSLAEVSKSKIITPEQERQAKDFRAATDNLKDAFEDFGQEVGGKLVPILTDAFEGMARFIEEAKKISDIDVPGPKSLGDWLTFAVRAPLDLPGAVEALVQTGEAVGEVNVVTDQMAKVWGEGKRAMIDAKPPAQNLNTEIERQKEVLDRARGAWDLFKNGLNIRAERLALDGDIEAFRKKWESSTDDAKANSREYQGELLRLQERVAGVATEVATTASAASRNLIKILIDTGEIERALRYIDMLKAGYDEARRLSYQDLQPNQPASAAPPPRPSAPAPPSMTPPKLTPRQADLLDRFKGLASGGTLTSSGLVMVGENGPELLGLPRGASVTPNIPQRLNDMAGGGTTIVVNVQAGLVSSPDQVGQQIIEAIKRAERRSGQVFAAA